MVKYKLKPLATAALSSALIVSSLSGFATTADAATKVQKVKNVKIKKGKLVKKSNGKVIKGYVSYKGVIYKDGKVFTGVLNKAYYKKGKKATGLYKSKYYKNGALGTGIYKNHYYKAGSLGTGTFKGKKYAKGKLFTGLSGKTYYKAGVLGTGNYKNKKYVKGKLFTGLSGKTYYKNGVLGTGSYEDHYYVKGKLATGEFDGILYEAGKPFTGEKDGIFYKDGKKDEDQTNVANFKKAETEVQKANDAFKKAKEQKDALDALAKKAGVSTQANLQTKNAADIDAFLAKYKDVDVSKLEGAELTEFKSALATNLTLATENLKTASTNVTNAVNTFVAAASVIASTADDALLAHIKTAVATATTVVASLKAAGYDTVQLENVLSKLPGGSTGGGNNNGGGSTGGGGNNNGGSTAQEKETETKVNAVKDAQAEVAAAQAELDELLAQKAAASGKLVTRDNTESILDKKITAARAKLTAATSKLLDAIQSLGTANLTDPQKAAVQTAALLATAVVADIVKNAPEDAQALKEKLDKLPTNTKPSKADEIKLVTAKVDALLSADGKALAEGVTQAQISEAKKLVGTLPEDTEQSTTKKAELLAKVENAQKLFTEQEANKTEAEKVKAVTALVDALFAKDSDGKVNYNKLADGVTQAQITAATTAVNDLKDGSALSDNVEKAQDLLDTAIIEATIAVDELFAVKETTPPTGGNTEDGNTEDGTSGGTTPATSTTEGNGNTDDNTTSPAEEPTKVERDYTKLAEGVTQEQITKAKDLVDALPKDAKGKDTLTTNVEKAQTLFTEQEDKTEAEKVKAATALVEALFAKDSEGKVDYTKLADEVTQEQITTADTAVKALKDGSALLDHVEKAQTLFTEQEDKTEADKVAAATALVEALFAKDSEGKVDYTKLADEVTQEQITTADTAVKALKDGSALLDHVEKAQALFTEQEANKTEAEKVKAATALVEALFAKDSEGKVDYTKLADEVTQEQITTADTAVKALKDGSALLDHVEKAQTLFTEQEDKTEADKVAAATALVEALFAKDSEGKVDYTKLAVGVTQEQITTADTAVKALKDGSALSVNVEKAQALFTEQEANKTEAEKVKAATALVDALFAKNSEGKVDYTKLADEVTQEQITTADTAVKALKDGSALLDHVEKAQTLFTEQEANKTEAEKVKAATALVDALFAKNSEGKVDYTKLADGVTQEQITTADTAVKALKDGSALLDHVEKAQTLFTEQEANKTEAEKVKAATALVDALFAKNSEGKVDYTKLADEVTQAQITTADTAVKALKDGSALSTHVEKAQELFATKLVDALFEANLNDEKLAQTISSEAITAAKSAVTDAKLTNETVKSTLNTRIDKAEALLTLSNEVDTLFAKGQGEVVDYKTLADPTPEQSKIDNLKGKVNDLVTTLEKNTTKIDLLAKVQKAQYLLDAKNDIDTNGNLVIKTDKTDINQLFTFQMAGIYTSDKKKEDRTLTTAQVVEGLKATINAKVSNLATTLTAGAFEVTGTTTEGTTTDSETTFKITTNLTKDQFNVLDANGNGAYLITVNENSNRKYKILFQLNNDTVTAKFVSGSILDGDFPKPQP